MQLVKEITTKTHRINSTIIEEVKQFHYDSKEERTSHTNYMEEQGFSNSGQVRENIGSVMNPDLVWFASYYKYEIIE